MSAAAWETLDDLRANGWSVAAHNDYTTDDGRPMVFWMMIHEIGIYEKANGATDAEALGAITHRASAIELKAIRLRDAEKRCPSCDRVWIEGETCTRGGCPMGGDF